ncbi:efflux RND transporter permease subunit [Qipengyuania qiaonensis]|uniref:Efflux RND transporter permease subunit n=1 Tax=Qipengyuania qiaonensis TaxID=2867240 RepID=A0ABS7J9L0_9SPHN|nr:efflux RND transporter permease subunit [Qipengyuania qiaonensis]MBX7481662.1 efflux RND transporter permease subunit [Qipengyuania qiaonensis]
MEDRFNLSALGVRERALTLFLIIAIVAAGSFAFFKLGRAEDPSFTVKAMAVTVAWPGASAQEMQELVADPLEKRMQELRWFDHVEATARPGFVTLQLELRDITPPSAVPEQWYQTRKKLSDEAANLPQGTIGPFFNDEFSDVYFALFAVAGRGLSNRELVQEAESIRSRLLGLEGVQKVVLIGEQPQRIFVDIAPARLATLGVPVESVIASLARQNEVVPAGAFQTDGPAIIVRASGAPDEIAAIRAVPVAANGRTLTIGDIAEVRYGNADPPDYAVRHDGRPAVLLGVVMQPRFNGLTLGETLDRETAAIEAGLPLGLEVTQIADQARNIDAAYGEFMIKFAVALAVIMAIGLVTLGWRVGIVVACAVPLTLAFVFVIMLMTGRDFDRITLGALILSLGLLVDDAIIAIEMMVVKMSEGMDRIRAATFAWHATAAPMLSGTLVTIAGFLPVGFAQSSAGEYAGNIFWIVAFALLASWLVAVYFTPYLGVKLLPEIEPVEGGHDALYATPRYERLRQWVGRSVARAPFVAAVTIGAMVVAAVLLAVVIPKQFFPSSDRTEVLVDVSLPKGTSFDVTSETVRAIEGEIREQPGVDQLDSFTGAGAPRFFLALNPEPSDPSFAKIVVQTADVEARDALRAHLERRIADGAFPAARVRVSQLIFGPPVPYPVVFRVSGPDIATTRDYAEQVRAIVAADPQTRDVHLDWGDRAPVLRLEYDQARLRLIGLTPADVSRQVAGLVSGIPVTQVRRGNRISGVVIRADTEARSDPSQLALLTIRTATGEAVTVGQLATITTAYEEPLIRTRDRQPTFAVRADIQPGLQPPDVSAAILPQLEELKTSLPAGYAIATGGGIEQSAKANAALAPIFPIMILVMLVIIMVQVRSFKLMALTFITAPLGLIGAVIALVVTGAPFGFNAILGLIGLAGILMRNTLILVDQIGIEKARGLDERAAVIEATVRRSRPVLLTALAAVLAFLPLTLSTFWGPLAMVLIGGTVVGTVLTLIVLPALYALFFGLASEPLLKRPIGLFRRQSPAS